MGNLRALSLIALVAIQVLQFGRAGAKEEVTDAGNSEEVGGLDVDLEVSRLEELPLVCRSWLLNNGGMVPKRNFNPWGGKRSLPNSSQFYGYPWEFLVKKGTGFNPWGGKRALPTYETANNRVSKNDSPNKSRSSFNPWGGRR